MIDDSDPVFDAFLSVEVDLNVSNLIEEATAFVIGCAVRSFYEGGGVVGEGNAFIYDPAVYGTEAIAESGLGLLDNMTFVAAPNVFGNTGTRKYVGKVDVLITGDEDRNLLESWISGSCNLTFFGDEDGMIGDFDDLEGYFPADCQSNQTALLACIRPGSNIQDSFFSFERDFGDSGSFFGRTSDDAGPAAEASGN